VQLPLSLRIQMNLTLNLNWSCTCPASCGHKCDSSGLKLEAPTGIISAAIIVPTSNHELSAIMAIPPLSRIAAAPIIDTTIAPAIVCRNIGPSTLVIIPHVIVTCTWTVAFHLAADPASMASPCSKFCQVSCGLARRPSGNTTQHLR